MKKNYFLLFFLCTLSIGLNSQNTNMASHIAPVDVPSHIVSINSKCYYLKKVDESCCSVTSSVVAINHSGQSLFATPVDNYGMIQPVKLIKTLNKRLVVCGWSRHACDVMQERNFMRMLDTNGTVIHTTTLQTASNNFYHPDFVDVVQHPDSSFYAISDSCLYHFDKNINLISKQNTGMTGLVSITALSSGNIILNGYLNNILKLVEMNTSLATVNQQTCSVSIGEAMQISSGNIIANSSAGLVKFSSSLNLLTVSSLNSTCTVSDFEMRNDSVFCTGITASSGQFYAVLDSALSVLYYTQTNYKGINPVSIALNNKNRVNILNYGFGSTNPQAITHGGLYQLPITGSLVSKYDLGVDSFTAANAFAVEVWSGAYRPDYSFYVTVKNYGADTVKKFFLNHYEPTGSMVFCSMFFHKQYTRSIAPGDTIVVQTGLYTGPWQFSNTGFAVMSETVCLFTTIPNNENDIDYTNNGFCNNITLQVTGIGEISGDEGLNIYPNPFMTELKIDAAFAIRKVTLINSQGVIMTEEEGGGATVNVPEHFPSGIYLIKVETEKGTSIKKAVKQ